MCIFDVVKYKKYGWNGIEKKHQCLLPYPVRLKVQGQY